MMRLSFRPARITESPFLARLCRQQHPPGTGSYLGISRHSSGGASRAVAGKMVPYTPFEIKA
jgi:hypothetical protein